MQFVTPQPFKEAIAKLGQKTVVAAGLDSEQWSRVDRAVRERAFFASRIENVRVLQRARGSIGDFLAANKEVVPDRRPGGQNMITALKTGSRADFVAQMQEFLAGEGITRTTGGLTDIASEKRLGLIFDVNVRQAQDFGNWQQGMDEDVLDAFPAQRFIRVIDVKEPRDAHTPHENTVMLKSDVGFWSALNEDFGVPWGPWGWGCGHDVEDVDRAEAEQLGLIAPGERPPAVEKDFNDGLESGTAQIDEDLREELRRAFADRADVEFTEDSVRWKQRQKK